MYVMDNRYPREEDWKQEESLWQGMSTESTLTRAVNRLKQAVLEDDVTVSCDIPALMHTIAQVLPADPSKTIESLLDDLFWLKWKDKIALDVVFGLREWKDLMAADHLLCYKDRLKHLAEGTDLDLPRFSRFMAIVEDLWKTSRILSEVEVLALLSCLVDGGHIEVVMTWLDINTQNGVNRIGWFRSLLSWLHNDLVLSLKNLPCGLPPPSSLLSTARWLLTLSCFANPKPSSCFSPSLITLPFPFPFLTSPTRTVSSNEDRKAKEEDDNDELLRVLLTLSNCSMSYSSDEQGRLRNSLLFHIMTSNDSSSSLREVIIDRILFHMNIWLEDWKVVETMHRQILCSTHGLPLPQTLNYVFWLSTILHWLSREERRLSCDRMKVNMMVWRKVKTTVRECISDRELTMLHIWCDLLQEEQNMVVNDDNTRGGIDDCDDDLSSSIVWWLINELSVESKTRILDILMEHMNHCKVIQRVMIDLGQLNALVTHVPDIAILARLSPSFHHDFIQAWPVKKLVSVPNLLDLIYLSDSILVDREAMTIVMHAWKKKMDHLYAPRLDETVYRIASGRSFAIDKLFTPKLIISNGSYRESKEYCLLENWTATLHILACIQGKLSRDVLDHNVAYLCSRVMTSSLEESSHHEDLLTKQEPLKGIWEVLQAVWDLIEPCPITVSALNNLGEPSIVYVMSYQVLAGLMRLLLMDSSSHVGSASGGSYLNCATILASMQTACLLAIGRVTNEEVATFPKLQTFSARRLNSEQFTALSNNSPDVEVEGEITKVSCLPVQQLLELLSMQISQLHPVDKYEGRSLLELYNLKEVDWSRAFLNKSVADQELVLSSLICICSELATSVEHWSTSSLDPWLQADSLAYHQCDLSWSLIETLFFFCQQLTCSTIEEHFKQTPKDLLRKSILVKLTGMDEDNKLCVDSDEDDYYGEYHEYYEDHNTSQKGRVGCFEKFVVHLQSLFPSSLPRDKHCHPHLKHLTVLLRYEWTRLLVMYCAPWKTKIGSNCDEANLFSVKRSLQTMTEFCSFHLAYGIREGITIRDFKEHLHLLSQLVEINQLVGDAVDLTSTAVRILQCLPQLPVVHLGVRTVSDLIALYFKTSSVKDITQKTLFLLCSVAFSIKTIESDRSSFDFSSEGDDDSENENDGNEVEDGHVKEESSLDEWFEQLSEAMFSSDHEVLIPVLLSSESLSSSQLLVHARDHFWLRLQDQKLCGIILVEALTFLQSSLNHLIDSSEIQEEGGGAAMKFYESMRISHLILLSFALLFSTSSEREIVHRLEGSKVAQLLAIFLRFLQVVSQEIARALATDSSGMMTPPLFFVYLENDDNQPDGGEMDDLKEVSRCPSLYTLCSPECRGAETVLAIRLWAEHELVSKKTPSGAEEKGSMKGKLVNLIKKIDQILQKLRHLATQIRKKELDQRVEFLAFLAMVEDFVTHVNPAGALKKKSVAMSLDSASMDEKGEEDTLFDRPKRKRKADRRRLRSRNPVIDEWLTDEEDDDCAYEDMLDFLVPSGVEVD